MIPLMLGICLDFYLIGRLILHSHVLSLALAALLLGLFSMLWFFLPRSDTLRKLARKKCKAF
jgi:hypothetical protein